MRKDSSALYRYKSDTFLELRVTEFPGHDKLKCFIGTFSGDLVPADLISLLQSLIFNQHQHLETFYLQLKLNVNVNISLLLRENSHEQVFNVGR